MHRHIRAPKQKPGSPSLPIKVSRLQGSLPSPRQTSLSDLSEISPVVRFADFDPIVRRVRHRRFHIFHRDLDLRLRRRHMSNHDLRRSILFTSSRVISQSIESRPPEFAFHQPMNSESRVSHTRGPRREPVSPVSQQAAGRNKTSASLR